MVTEAAGSSTVVEFVNTIHRENFCDDVLNEIVKHLREFQVMKENVIR